MRFKLERGNWSFGYVPCKSELESACIGLREVVGAASVASGFMSSRHNHKFPGTLLRTQFVGVTRFGGNFLGLGGSCSLRRTRPENPES